MVDMVGVLHKSPKVQLTSEGPQIIQEFGGGNIEVESLSCDGKKESININTPPKNGG